MGYKVKFKKNLKNWQPTPMPPLPNRSELKKLSLGKLDALAMKISDIIEDDRNNLTGHFRISDVKDPAIRAVFQERNKRAYAAIQASTALKKFIKSCTKFDGIFPDVANHYIEFSLPEDIIKRGINAVLKAYDQDFRGYWSTARFNARGNVEKIFFTDTYDMDIFFDFVLKHYTRKRDGDSPQISATIFKPGFVLTTRKGKSFMVAETSKTKRWVPAPPEKIPAEHFPKKSKR